MFKYYFAAFLVGGSALAYGLKDDIIANAHSNDGSIIADGTDTEKFTEEISRGTDNQRPTLPQGIYMSPGRERAESDENESLSTIPTVMLPNNVCVINTDISPDRTIEEHIVACVHAQRIRNSLTQ
jgi:hypothetical protein